MDPLTDRLEELGQKVARAADDSGRSGMAIAQGRELVRASLAASARPTWPLLKSAAALGLAALLGIGSYALWQARPGQPLTFAVEARDSAPERATQTGELETKQLRFSDGTTLSLQPSSRIEVHTLTSSGATIGLVAGRARASVERKQGAHWQFLAGPFFVEVTGTEFDLGWDPEARVFELALHEGSVEVAGPSLKGARRVGQGEYMRIELNAEGTDARAAEEAPPAALPVPAESLDALPQAQAPEAGPETSWSELLRSGQRKAAFASLDRLGPSAFNQASSQELWDLAHAARLGGRPKLAEQALVTLRQRHGARGQTAFLLGKVAADQLNRAPEAITWFQTYLAESPQGPLAEQALGRLVELQAGTRAGKRAAKEYLGRYPTGAYASFARSLLR